MEAHSPIDLLNNYISDSSQSPSSLYGSVNKKKKVNYRKTSSRGAYGYDPF